MERQSQRTVYGREGRISVEEGARGEANTTYYGLPMIKKPTWKWYIPLYIFIGGVSGGAALIGGLADLCGGARHRRTVRHARWVALVGAILSPLLLIADLGRRPRFHHMLRVLKISSPMSVGSWLLTAFGFTSGALAAKQAAEDGLIVRRDSRPARLARQLPSGPLSGLHALLGLGLAGYTGILIAATAVPLWFAGGLLLGPLFLATGVASGASLLVLLSLRRGRSAADTKARAEIEQVATVASAAQVSLTAAREAVVSRRVSRPLHSGPWGVVYQVSAVGTGMLVPLALRLPAQLRRRPVGRALSATAATLSLVGALAERFAIVEAGKRSASDPLAYQEITTADPGVARPTPSIADLHEAVVTDLFRPGQVAPEPAASPVE